MPMRFLFETQVVLHQTFTVDAQRAHYLCNVMRKRAGDAVACFDGQGLAFDAELTLASSRQCELRVTQIAAPATPVSPALHLGMAVLKGQAMDRALIQATELGVTSIQLLAANRCNVQLKLDRLEKKMDHWRKVVAGACEQSGLLFVPQIFAPTSTAQVLQQTTADLAVLDMSGERLPHKLPSADRLILIGPEGGWDDSERAIFESAACSVYQIAATTLRAETTPAVALALFRHAIQG